ncbi:antibiotic biosynthesis monooxygenase [Sphingomonas ginsenosidivorax]|uniref:Antibiotic biosynthesis monooxygenase n=1 Tax=Sphingomonas ginsenosidivorax TaxID=862135 RepID=A0A5C6UIZ5_9SPHN|nr:antibiotic biosynthesis monooxygenase [Sphingomonas ginsenosidivorax]TXC72206.1 antibiotic biosynthesis monooxygenase [Sphingomonas ginsenosidivorax]
MDDDRNGQVAVIFVSQRTAADDAGYAAAADAMDRLAAAQPGYRGIDSARGTDGIGVTVSYWRDEAAAIAWRGQVDHAAIREMGRARWYAWYTVSVATVTRGYRWDAIVGPA